MHSAVAAVEVAAVDVLDVVASCAVPESLLVLSARVTCVHLLLLGHVQQVQVRVLYALDLRVYTSERPHKHNR